MAKKPEVYLLTEKDYVIFRTSLKKIMNYVGSKKKDFLNIAKMAKIEEKEILSFEEKIFKPLEKLTEEMKTDNHIYIARNEGQNFLLKSVLPKEWKEFNDISLEHYNEPCKIPWTLIFGILLCIFLLFNASGLIFKYFLNIDLTLMSPLMMIAVNWSIGIIFCCAGCCFKNLKQEEPLLYKATLLRKKQFIHIRLCLDETLIQDPDDLVIEISDENNGG
jgi:hypothetical protein